MDELIKYCWILFGLSVDGSNSGDDIDKTEDVFWEDEYGNEDLYDDWEMFYILRDHLKNNGPIIIENEVKKMEFSERNNEIVMTFLN